MIAGISLAILPFAPKVDLTKDLIFSVLLPPLIFEAAFFLHWRELRRDLPVILILASAGVLLSAVVTAFGMAAIAGWPWAAALVFGVLIAATDPVSVIATFKEAGVKGRLRLLVEAESLAATGQRRYQGRRDGNADEGNAQSGRNGGIGTGSSPARAICSSPTTNGARQHDHHAS